MTPTIANMPGNAGLADWLDRALASPYLGELVGELETLNLNEERVVSLNDIVGDKRAAVLNNGLSELSEANLMELLASPKLLLDLQELVFLEGGDYWRLLATEEADAESLARLRERLTSTVVGAEKVTRPASNDFSRYAVVFLAAACLVLAAFATWPLFVSSQTEAIAWGWNAADAMPENATTPEYFEAIADGGEAWFNRSPESKIEFAIRLSEYRQGCSRLILSEHKPLSLEDRTWLTGKCRDWAGKLDEHLADLEAADKPFSQTLQETNETVRRLVSALRERAEERDA